MSLAKIKGSEYPLEAIFDGHFFFSIPLFQRPYAWTTEQAEELLDDFLDSLDNEDESNSYFLGSIVVIKEDNPLKPEAQVVDGQQRLMTLTILISVLRYLLRKSGNIDYADSLTNRIYKKADVIAKKPATYLLALRREEQFFQEYVQNDAQNGENIKQLMELTNTKNDSQKNIKDNAKLFFNKLEAKSELELKRLVDFMFLQCFMIVVSTPDSDSAFRIFSILNDRGLNLSHTDKLKSELIGEIHETKQQDAAALWESKEDQLGRDAFGDLFYHIRMIKHPEKLRKDILKEFRQFVIDPIADPIKVIQEIIKYATVYDDIRNEAYESSNGAEDINKKLSWLNKIDNKDWLPPAIHYMSLNKNPKELNHFLTDLDRLATGLMICRADVNKRIKRYGRILKTITDDQDLYETTSPLQLTPEERNEIVVRLDGDLYLESKFRLYVLLRLNDALLEEGVKFNFSRVTIEHVLPQELPKGGIWEEWFSESIHIKYVHKLGNLILLTGPKNKGNDEFKDVIDRRQREQIEKLKAIWRL
jgi:uncharacterized protein with ParB-like and HNH nuclease domain